MLREGFDVELVSNGWSVDLDQPFPRPDSDDDDDDAADSAQADGHERAGRDPEGSSVALYEEAVQDPTMDALQLAGRNTHSTQLEVETIDTQTFFAQQLKVLEAFRQKNDEASRETARHKPHKKLDDDHHLVGGGGGGGETDRPVDARVLEHIGPVQFNMGGIQVDADDMVQRLKVCLFFFPLLWTVCQIG